MKDEQRELFDTIVSNEIYMRFDRPTHTKIDKRMPVPWRMVNTRCHQPSICRGSILKRSIDYAESACVSYVSI